MKRVAYYVLLTLTWILSILILGLIFVPTGLFGKFPTFMESFGASCGHPQILLMALGVMLLLRPVVNHILFKDNRSFKKRGGIICIILGAVWLIWILIPNFTTKQTQSTESARTSSIESTLTVEEMYEATAKEMDKELIAFVNQMKEQLPYRIDEITTLDYVFYMNRQISYYYTLDLEYDSFEDGAFKDFLSDIKQSQKELIPSMIQNGGYTFGLDELHDYMKITNLNFKFVYLDKDGKTLGVNKFNYLDF